MQDFPVHYKIASPVKYILLIFFIMLSLVCRLMACEGDTITLKGQASAWAIYGSGAEKSLMAGARYIPQLNFTHQGGHLRQLDFEASANIFGSAESVNSTDMQTRGSIDPYRAWARYSTAQLELRAGLQKINFGSASLFRPLMWFDRMDPRDPLMLTKGVWGILGRYYLLNNANIWVWCLYGNKDAKTWETGSTVRKIPEAGARFQLPVSKGETGISYHFRTADTRNLISLLPGDSAVPEHRIGIDGKWDIGPGIWFEGAWIHKTRFTGFFTDQVMVAVGADYTFSLGNGLNILGEHLVADYGEKPFNFTHEEQFTGCSVMYPFDINDQVSAILYRDWKGDQLYSFFNWKHRFSHFSTYLMIYLNPDHYSLPQQKDGNLVFAGKGVQLMLVYNH